MLYSEKVQRLLLPLLLSPSSEKVKNIADSLPFVITAATIEGDSNYTAPLFPILPFQKYENNPILVPDPSSSWSSDYLYNPTAIVLNETVFLLYRAQNKTLESSIGLAWSTDGTSFTRLSHPIVQATEPWELQGGVEDPRIVRVNGTFYLTYTGYNAVAKQPQLCIATSIDLLHWNKYPPLFPGFQDVAYSPIDVPMPRINHTKSGAIIKEPTKDGLYHMYFGDSYIFHSTSRDMLHWSTPLAEDYFAAPINPWENNLIEPGPAPIKTRDGKWILFYNGATSGRAGYPKGQYSTGQMLIDPSNSFRPDSNSSAGYRPALRDGPIARLQNPFLVPEKENEQFGQVNQVVFSEGLVQFKGKWYLYFGQADSELGVAIADVQP